jgi:hypothetical protein
VIGIASGWVRLGAPRDGAASRTLRLVISTALLAGCAPVTVARIGPALAPRQERCEIEVLDRGQTPQRPYRDVGLVTVETCEDYRTPPCRAWIEEAACRLGGQIVYTDENPRPASPASPALRAQVLVAAYVSDLRPDPETDAVLRSRTCDPPCGAGQRCVNRECVAADAPCPAGELKTPETAAPPMAEPAEKCLE